jgi:hypothetical protein
MKEPVPHEETGHIKFYVRYGSHSTETRRRATPYQGLTYRVTIR